MWIQKKEKIKSENKSEFKNVKIGIHMMRKFKYNSHMKIKKYKIHSYELSKWDMKLIIVIMWYKYEKWNVLNNTFTI